LQEGPDVGITEKSRDIYQYRVKEKVVLVGIGLEEIAVVDIAGDARIRHALADPPDQRRLFVISKVETARLADEGQQLVEILVIRN
jgi:hypothetical protein